MQPPLKRLSEGTGQQESQRMRDVDDNFGRVEQAIDTLNANASLWQYREVPVPSTSLSAGFNTLTITLPTVDGYVPKFAVVQSAFHENDVLWIGNILNNILYAQAYARIARSSGASFLVWYKKANAITSCEAAAAAVNNDRLWRLEESEDNIVSIYPVPESEMFPKIAVTYSQEGTGEPSPDNIRPIVGIDELELVHTGKNLAILEQGTFAGADGALVPSNTRVRTQKIRVFPNQQYAVNYYSNWDLRNVALYDVNGNYSACTTSNFTPSISGGIKIATIPSNIYYIRLVLSHMDQTTPVTPSYCNFQVEHSSTATDYEPYGEIHPVSLPETLYGGVIDFERGVVRKEWHYIKFNGTENWNKPTDSNSFLYYLPTTFETHDNGYDFICSYCVPRDFYSEVPYCYFTGLQNNKRTIFLIRLRDQEERSIDEWKSYLAAQYNAGTPLEICYPLYEPIETTIDLPTIQALQQLDKYTPRQNVITTSKGALSVGYAKSPIRESDEIQAFLEGLGG